MQDCFRQHPDVYGSELDDDEVNAEDPSQATDPQVDEPSVLHPTPATTSTHNPEVNEPSIYQPPSTTTLPISPQVDEPSRLSQDPPATSIPAPAPPDNIAAPANTLTRPAAKASEPWAQNKIYSALIAVESQR